MSVADNNGAPWPAPGKLNLMLRIVGRRADGYHLLQTVFQFIELCDWLSFQVHEHGEVVLINPLPGVPMEQDLTVRAARLLQRETGCAQGVTIGVDKRLPMGGGLGGGSSDAATTLVALNHLWRLGLDSQRLQTLGLTLGADVPVFVKGVAAWAEGVGEVLTPLVLPEPWFVVLAPDCHVATGKVFSAQNLTRSRDPIKIADFPAVWQANDCTDVVTELYPPVKAALRDLAEFSGLPKLTGTGACVFAAFDNERAAASAADALRSRWRLWLTRGANRSALLDRLTAG
ncbi:MAG: 4-(cytidine 5'-diphospho)-2-C-methyl-D-erythritol kinase [Methylococcaceae bacterium]|nr:MAG: 4-(cytidine 5'-diphospho)-2-C-methyl-D-erythritol kinase [Methylococcaceae bacterium]